MSQETVDYVKKKAQREADENDYPQWEDIFDGIGGKLVSEEFVEEHRWYSLFEQVYQVGSEYFRVYYESGNETYEPEFHPDNVAQVYPQEVTIVKYTTSPD